MTRLVLPGYLGSGPGHWQRRWLDLDVTARLVEQDDWERPELSAWLARLEAAVAGAPGAVLVAHSLGAALVTHFAARHPRAPVAGALLVAPADVDALVPKQPQFESFAPLPRAPLPFPSVLAASRNDPYVAFARAEAMAADWGSGLVDLGNAGHVNIESGHGPWADGFHLVAALGREAAAA